MNESAQTQSSNGSSSNNYDMAAVSENLQDEITVGYLPRTPMEAMWTGTTDAPHITFRRDIEHMILHPIVTVALEYYRAGIAGAEFWGGPDYNNPDNDKGKPICADPRVAEFVMAHCERFWQRGVPLIQEGGYPYGWAAGEHIYKEVNIDNAFGKKMLVWSHLKDFHPNDSHILTIKYQPVGVRIKNVREKQPVDLHFASESIPAKACWYPHRPRFNQFYGRSQFIGAWLPWRMLGWRDGMDQVINAAVYRAGYVGPIIGHPTEDMPTAQSGIPSTKVDGQGIPRRGARDVARQMVEWAKAGAGFTKSTAKYPQAQGGGDKWTIDFPQHVMDVNPLIEAARWAEDRIMLGMGVPPELVKAGGTGSGYSGRSIPREAFLDGQQKVANAFLQIFVEQVIKPLVLWNFGDIPFEVSCKSLLKSQADDKQGDDQNGQNGKNNQVDKQKEDKLNNPPSNNPLVQPNQQPPTAPALSITNPNMQDRVLSIIQRLTSKGVS